MANAKRDAGRETFWRRILARHEGSKLSVREFCCREKLRESAFYFWRRTIHQRGLARLALKQPSPKQPDKKPPAFVPLILDATNLRSSAGPAAGITLVLRGGRSLRLSESFPVERLASLVLALESAEGRP